MSAFIRLAAASLFLLCGASSQAINPASWVIDESFTPSDTAIHWTSPTAIDIGLANYLYNYEITEARAYYFLGSTDLLPHLGDQVSGSGAGRLPAVLIDEQISETFAGFSVSAHLFVEVGADGYADAVIDDITLPSLVTEVQIVAGVNIEGFDFGDYNLSGDVTQADYATWSADYGRSGEGEFSDGNLDGVVNAADYTVWRDNLAASGEVAGQAAPEPTAILLLAAMSFVSGPLSVVTHRRRLRIATDN